MTDLNRKLNSIAGRLIGKYRNVYTAQEVVRSLPSDFKITTTKLTGILTKEYNIDNLQRRLFAEWCFEGEKVPKHINIPLFVRMLEDYGYAVTRLEDHKRSRGEEIFFTKHRI